MAKIVGVHRLALKPGVRGPDFEQFMRENVFPGLGIVIQVDKTISHAFTLGDWRRTEHFLLRSNQDEKDGNYLWMIVANVADDKVQTEEARHAVGREAEEKAQEFFDLGSNQESIAAVKLSPFATRTSFATFIEMGHCRLGE
jgi:hypothetical protein